jgi:hypothetical protein
MSSEYQELVRAKKDTLKATASKLHSVLLSLLPDSTVSASFRVKDDDRIAEKDWVEKKIGDKAVATTLNKDILAMRIYPTNCIHGFTFDDMKRQMKQKIIEHFTGNAEFMITGDKDKTN